MKRCSRCGQSKTLDNYTRDKQAPDGLNRRCRDCKRELSRRYEQNPKRRAYAKEWREANRDKARESTRKWQAENRDHYNELKRQWRERNPEAGARYYEANRERVMENVLRRRAKIRGAGPVSFKALWEEQGGVCGICGEPIDTALKYPDPESRSIDHIVPLSKGGLHNQGNLQWAHLVCNLKKGTSVPPVETPVTT